MRSRGARDERGAIAILVAAVAVVLLVVAALTVDLGKLFVAKRDVQKRSDLAALAGAHGDNLPAPNAIGTCTYGDRASATDQAVLDVASYFARTATVAPTAASLVDCNLRNGEAVYGDLTWTSATTATLAYNKNKLTVVSPPDPVPFGFAKVVGVDGTTVTGRATVEIKSPRYSTLPFYSFSGCDYGPQTLQQPNNGQSGQTLMLYAPSETNAATLTSVTPTSYPAGTAAGTMQPIDLAGTNLAGVTEVGFFESGNAVAGPPPVTTVSFTVNVDGTLIHLDDLPDNARGVTGVQQFWYIRVKIGGQWSAVYRNTSLNAPKLTIGTPPLLCGQGSTSGNFGTMLLENQVGGGWDKMGAANVAVGLDSTLGVYPLAGRRADGTCDSSQTETVLWTAEGTNCVSTDTGMSAKVATGGFLGVGSAAPAGKPGLLAKPFTTKCGPGDTPATDVVMGKTINNDTLTCFFTNGTVNVGEIQTASYPGPVVLSTDIYSSPRFGWVPVLPAQPATGSSKRYQIVEFRPCFLTDQPASAVKGDQPSATNGIVTDGNGVHSIQIIFINEKALPPRPGAQSTGPYVGSGVKILRLVN